ncbi:hypothetical protein ACWGI9_02585 [Streptomyces sp. NPDC054833]
MPTRSASRSTATAAVVAEESSAAITAGRPTAPAATTPSMLPAAGRGTPQMAPTSDCTPQPSGAIDSSGTAGRRGHTGDSRADGLGTAQAMAGLVRLPGSRRLVVDVRYVLS